MPRVKAELPGGVRISDLMTVMVLARVFPTTRVKAILAETGKESIRERRLPATLMVYYVMALALYMQTSYQEILRCVFEAFNWFARLGKQAPIAGKSAIAQARERLGEAPLKRLYNEMVAPIATEKTTGAYHRGWLLVSLDGSTLDVGDTADNERAFGRPGVSRGDGSAFPKFWGFLLAHHAVRSIMHEAALRSEIDPDRLSYSHAVRVIRRKLPLFTITPPSGVAEAV